MRPRMRNPKLTTVPHIETFRGFNTSSQTRTCCNCHGTLKVFRPANVPRWPQLLKVHKILPVRPQNTTCHKTRSWTSKSSESAVPAKQNKLSSIPSAMLYSDRPLSAFTLLGEKETAQTPPKKTTFDNLPFIYFYVLKPPGKKKQTSPAVTSVPFKTGPPAERTKIRVYFFLQSTLVGPKKG